MSTATKSRNVVCQICTTTPPRPETGYGLTPDAGARAIGWTVWEGRTIGGSEERRVFCPRCSGRTPEPETDAEPKWDARCNTCDWQASDADDYDDEPFTEADAKAWKQDHECEPDVDLIAPKALARRP